MISKLLSLIKLKKILLAISIAFLAYQTAKIIPNMLTLSLSSWMYMAFSIILPVVLVIITLLRNFRVAPLRISCYRSSPGNMERK